MKIEFLDETDSTNTYIKKYLKESEDVLVCARRQTGGKGTKGRSFLSDEGGVYLSALVFYHDFPAKEAFRIMMRSALAVSKTAEAFGLSPKIKWANDVLINEKKLAGILIENTFSGKNISSSIIGIGLNVENDLTPIDDIAISLSGAAGRRIPYADGRDALIENCRRYLIENKENFTADGTDEYPNYLLKGNFEVIEGEKRYSAFVKRVLPDGRLEVETDGKLRLLSSAEVTIRISKRFDEV